MRPLEAGDWPELAACAADPLIWEQHPEPNRYEPAVFRKFFDAAMASGGAFATLDAKTGRIIGSSRFYDLKPEIDQITVGYTFLTRAYWGGRHNREAKQLMLDHAFRFVDRVVFEIGRDNLRSRKAIEKIGARLADEYLTDKGVYVLYSLGRNDWV